MKPFMEKEIRSFFMSTEDIMLNLQQKSFIGT